MTPNAEESSKRIDVFGIGEPLFEFNRSPDAGIWHEGIGGDTSNAIVAARRCGAVTGFFTALGDDIFAAAIHSMWRREGVDASTVLTDGNAPTGVYFVTHGASGHDFSYLRKGSAASLIEPGDLPVLALRATRVLHVSGISQAISPNAADCVRAAIEIVRQGGGLVSYDTNLRLKLWPLERARAVIHETMTQVDIALPGLDDAVLLTRLTDPDAIADFYLRLGASIVALTLGREGCLVATRQRRERIGSISVAAVDATGAGDTFDGAFLAQYLVSGDPFQAGHFANVAAALSTCGFGAVAPMPRRADVLARMARH